MDNTTTERLLAYNASPTQLDFHNDTSFLKGIAGPPGGGKSVAALMEGLFRAMRQPPNRRGERRYRLGVVRDTYPRLITTTVVTIKQWLDEFGQLKSSPPITGEYTVPLMDGTKAILELTLVSMNNDGPDSLKSLELSGAWLHEASEIEEEVFDRLIQRVGRYPAVKDGAPCLEPGVWCDFNLTGKGHWLFRRFMTGPDVTVYEVPQDNGTIKPMEVRRKLYLQPPAVFCENIDEVEKDKATPIYQLNPQAENLANLAPGYYARQLLENPTTEQWNDIKAFLLMQWTTKALGRLVFEKEFSRHAHVAERNIEPTPGSPVIIGIDTSGLHPAGIFTQTAAGTTAVTDEMFGDNMAFEQFITDLLLPIIASNYPGCPVLAVCDPSNPRDARTGITPVQLLNSRGVRAVVAATNTFSVRRQAVSTLLTKRNGFIISPNCVNIIDGFESSYVYKQLTGTSSSAPVYSSTPDKTQVSSHYMDGLQYAALHLTRRNEQRDVPPAVTANLRRRAIV